MALCCDLRVAGKNAKIGLPETRLAIIPGYLLLITVRAGGTQRLPRIVGVAKAKELIYTARILNSKEALEFGVVNRAEEDAYEAALNLAQSIIPQGPVAIRMAKVAIDRGSQMDMYLLMLIL